MSRSKANARKSGQKPDLTPTGLKRPWMMQAPMAGEKLTKTSKPKSKKAKKAFKKTRTTSSNKEKINKKPKTSKCPGCFPTYQPNQTAHYGPNGCIGYDDSVFQISEEKKGVEKINVNKLNSLVEFIKTHKDPVSCFADESTTILPILSKDDIFPEFRVDQAIEEEVLKKFTVEELRTIGIAEPNIKSPTILQRGFNDKTGSWHCTVCGEDMGSGNPRQLCRKSYCPLE